jgi:polyhydroxyalkanoate synthesis regulator phasin
MSDQPETTGSETPEASGGAGSLDPAGDRVGDALRAAVERTLAATAGSATGTRRRAEELLDDVVRRGQVARDEVARRGEEATSRLGEAINELRSADAEGVAELSERLGVIERRLAALEAAGAPSTPPSKADVEVETTASEPHQQAESGD